MLLMLCDFFVIKKTAQLPLTFWDPTKILALNPGLTEVTASLSGPAMEAVTLEVVPQLIYPADAEWNKTHLPPEALPEFQRHRK